MNDEGDAHSSASGVAGSWSVLTSNDNDGESISAENPEVVGDASI